MARGVHPEKYTKGLGQMTMAVVPPDQDMVTLAAEAVSRLLDRYAAREPLAPLLNRLDWVLFATESGVDQSKSAALYLHRLCNLPAHLRVLELKQACYAGTAGLQMALNHVRLNPGRVVLWVASDVARYGLGTPGESSQGAAAVAALVTAYPRLIELDGPSGVYAEEVMDFWRPPYREEAFVRGAFSCEVYNRFLQKTWQHYLQHVMDPEETRLKRICYHVSVPRVVEKAHDIWWRQYLAQHPGAAQEQAYFEKGIEASLYYGRHIGNCYTAALLLSLSSLLEQDATDLSGARIGFYSYGSGAMAEFFSGRLVPGYEVQLNKVEHERLLGERISLDMDTYERLYLEGIGAPDPTGELVRKPYEVGLSLERQGKACFLGFSAHRRVYGERQRVFESAPVIDSASAG